MPTWQKVKIINAARRWLNKCWPKGWQMSCKLRENPEKVDAYLRGEMTATEREEIDTLIANDPDCRQFIEEQRLILQGIRRYGRQRLKAEIHQQLEAARRQLRYERLQRVAVAAALILAASIPLLYFAIAEQTPTTDELALSETVSERDSDAAYKAADKAVKETPEELRKGNEERQKKAQQAQPGEEINSKKATTEPLASRKGMPADSERSKEAKIIAQAPSASSSAAADKLNAATVPRTTSPAGAGQMPLKSEIVRQDEYQMDGQRYLLKRRRVNYQAGAEAQIIQLESVSRDTTAIHINIAVNANLFDLSPDSIRLQEHSRDTLFLDLYNGQNYEILIPGQRLQIRRRVD
jgi:hypothetical protein